MGEEIGRRGEGGWREGGRGWRVREEVGGWGKKLESGGRG